MTVTLLIADDYELIRLGLRSLLNSPDIKIVGEASSTKQAIELAAKHKPAVALIDINMPEKDGFWALSQIRKKSSRTGVIMMSADDNATHVTRALEGGAADFVLKDVPRHELVYAVHRAATGEGEPACRKMRGVRITMAKRKNRQDDCPLTNRELQVVRLIAGGLSNQQIADKLEISIETVKEHVQHLLRRLKLESRTQAALWALNEGLVK